MWCAGGYRLSTASRQVAGHRAVYRLLLTALKIGLRIADSSFVRKSTVLTGLTLALGAATLAGVGEWATKGFPGFLRDAADTTVGVERVGSSDAPMVRTAVPGATAGAAAPPEFTIRRTVPEVRLQFTVADERGKPVQGLAASDIKILEDQSQVASLQSFTPDENLPLRIGILLDASDSVKKVIPQEKATALSFLQSVLHQDTDRAFVMGFGTRDKLWQGSTSSLPQLVHAVDQLAMPSSGTNLYDAVYSACNEHLWQHHENELVHRALVLISDGEDTISFHGLPDAVAMAQKSETQIYALTLHPKSRPGRGDAIMKALAEQTGGTFFVAGNANEMQRVFAQLEQEMRSQYFVTFRPQQEKPGFHALRVEVRTPQKLHIHARQGYYAEED